MADDPITYEYMNVSLIAVGRYGRMPIPFSVDFTGQDDPLLVLLLERLAESRAKSLAGGAVSVDIG